MRPHGFLGASAAGALLLAAIYFSAGCLAEEELPPTTTQPMGRQFADPQPPGTVRVLLVGAGSSHDYPRYFLTFDAQTIRSAGNFDAIGTPNLEEALQRMPAADVLVFCGNHDQYGTAAFQQALHRHADAGKGLILLHAGTWIHPWDNGRYNQRFVGGGSRSHGSGLFPVEVNSPQHPIMQGVPASFEIHDESYHHEFADAADVEVLATNDHRGRRHASVWVVRDAKAPLACITFGHDEPAHHHPAFQQILQNAVRWASVHTRQGEATP